jgi:hypothetical protein
MPEKSAARGAARRPALEVLEDRCVPAEYFWNGPVVGGVWSNPAYWISTMPGTVPGVGSFVFYNSSATSVDDLNIPSPGLGWLVLGTQAGTLNVQGSLQQGPGTFLIQEGGNVQVSGSLTNGGVYNQFAGTVSVTSVLRNSGQYDLFGGSVAGTGKFLNQGPAPQTVMYIAPFGSVTLDVNLENFNQINWVSGNIDLEKTLTNMGSGAIAVNTPGTMSGAGGLLVNDSGAIITASTGGTATINVLLGIPNTNYGLVNVTKGGLEFAEPNPFTNEGRITASAAGSGSSVTFDGPFQQLANTQNGGLSPVVASFAGDSVTFAQGAVISAGTLGVLGTATAEGTATGDTLTVNSGGRAVLAGNVFLTGSFGDSGIVALNGGNVSLGLFGRFDINAGGTLSVSAAAAQSIIANGPVYNSGMLTENPGAQLLLQNVLYSQTATGVTNLNGSASPGGSVLFDEVGTIDQTGGVFNVSNATVDSQGYVVEVGATLNVGAGTNVSSFNGDVTILGAMAFADGNNVTVNFNNNLTLGDQSAAGNTAVVSLYLTDVINVADTTTFGLAVFNFLNVPPPPPPPPPPPYMNIHLGTVQGLTPTVNLPPGWQWAIVGGVLEVF